MKKKRWYLKWIRIQSQWRKNKCVPFSCNKQKERKYSGVYGIREEEIIICVRH